MNNYLKKTFLKTAKDLGVLVILVGLIAISHVASAQTITTNQTGTHNGFFYSFWNDNSAGSASMTLGAGGNYTTTWNNVGNFIAGKGWAIGGPRNITFSGSFNGGVNGFLAVYGWTRNPVIEYHIVENHGAWVPPGGVSIGTLTSDGSVYNIYKMDRANVPCITGPNCNYQQFWSVRSSKRTSGTVTTSNHFNAWKNKSMILGTTWDYQIMETEGFHSTGSSNITVGQTACCNSADDTPSSHTSSSVAAGKTLVVRAKGVGGGESITLKVNNTAVKTWSLTTTMTDYTATTSLTGGILVQYTNDSANHDVQVDYISVNGAVRQSEAQTYNTGVYQNGACGGGNGMSEWLHCNGAIGYGNL